MDEFPRGVSKLTYKTGTVRYRAQYIKGKKKMSKVFETVGEAINQRKNWEREYGDTIWGTVPDNIKGHRFGRLVAVKIVGNRPDTGGTIWLCQCDCGNEIEVRKDNLKSEKVKSCGCLFEEKQNVKKARKTQEENAIDGVELDRFTDKPFAHNTSGYRGVQEYKPGKFKARITVKGKEYNLYGFKTARDAYYNGRLVLEDEHLPRNTKKPPTN